MVYHHRGEVAWEHHQLLAVEFLVVYQGEVAGGVSRMTDVGVGQSGVAKGTFCGDTTGKAICGVGVP